MISTLIHLKEANMWAMYLYIMSPYKKATPTDSAFASLFWSISSKTYSLEINVLHVVFNSLFKIYE